MDVEEVRQRFRAQSLEDETLKQESEDDFTGSTIQESLYQETSDPVFLPT